MFLWLCYNDFDFDKTPSLAKKGLNDYDSEFSYSLKNIYFDDNDYVYDGYEDSLLVAGFELFSIFLNFIAGVAVMYQTIFFIFTYKKIFNLFFKGGKLSDGFVVMGKGVSILSSI